MRESKPAFSHSLMVLQISYYIINLSVSVPPFSSHFTSGQLQHQIYTRSSGIDLTGGHNLCGGASDLVWNMIQPSCHAAEMLSSDCCCLPFMACQCLKGPWSIPTLAPSFSGKCENSGEAIFLKITKENFLSLLTWNAYPCYCFKKMCSIFLPQPGT